ncbi:MAG TPA: hypothetical protein PK354_02480 [bacterium]|nr:hypothetical protein [bacterium]
MKLASNVSALHSAGFGQSTAIDMAERCCFPTCFVSAPSLIVHNASVFPGGSGEKQGKAKKTEKYSMDFSKILFNKRNEYGDKEHSCYWCRNNGFRHCKMCC